ncbi:MAG: prolyl oligopeptidase family serine peptidase [Solirubrobacteraceae bacterium]|nr:prolyl oligopeptidase family serine peptidase [Solirubrobacteraceae bacterium]
MSLKNRSIRVLILTASATAVLLPGASLAQAKATVKGPAGNAFYKASAKQIKAGKPGTMIWARQVKYTANGRVALPSASKTMLVLYRSLDPKGKPIAVSGTIDLPKGKAPKGGFKVISWAHGTTGAADACAPSRNANGGPADGYISYATASYDGWVKAGYAVLRTDYEGLGTPGPHPYLIGASEGRAVVDIALAAREIWQVGKDWLIGGHSQGGHAALFAASLAPKLAPKLKMKGVFAYAPASHLWEQGQAISGLGAGFEGLSGLAIMILNSAAREAGVDPSTLVTPQVAAKLGKLEEVCSAQLGGADIFGAIQPKDLLRPGVTTASIDAALKAMNPNVKIKAPVLVVQGLDDGTVFPVFTDALVNELKKSGDNVTYDTFAGLTHSSVVTDAAVKKAISAWIKARLR